MDSHDILLDIAKQHFDPEKEWPWLEKKLEALQNDFKDRSFFLSFSMCSRFISQEIIHFPNSELERLEAIYPNFNTVPWTREEIARILLMTALPVSRNQVLLDKLFSTADYKELMVLYKGLYFLENAADFMLRAREGLRTNMIGVFVAIALHNPYPYKYLSEDAWNHMVLKAVFMDQPIYKVYQIEARKNPKLALIFLDYAHERWSGHRSVTPELWRFVSGYADSRFFEDLKKVIQGTDELERIAAIKALADSSFPDGKDWLVAQDISTEQLPSWEEIGQQVEQAKVLSN